MDENQPRQLARPEEKPGSKTELKLKFTEESTLLIVAVKLPGEAPRVMPMELDVDLPTFIMDFPFTWRELGEKVRAEFVRGAAGRGA